jgi:TRAP-type C4-dicarboxylate transport system permease large subunit
VKEHKGSLKGLTMSYLGAERVSPADLARIYVTWYLVLTAFFGGIVLYFWFVTPADGTASTGAILLILVGGTFMSRFLGHSGAVRALSEFMLGLEMPAFFYFLIYGVLILVLGMFLEAFAIMVLVLPLMYPILVDVGFHPIWIGILTIKLVEIGLITPPVGLNVYVVRSASPVPMSLNDVFAGITPFLLLDAVTIALLIAFPGIVLLMPSLVA